MRASCQHICHGQAVYSLLKGPSLRNQLDVRVTVSDNEKYDSAYTDRPPSRCCGGFVCQFTKITRKIAGNVIYLSISLLTQRYRHSLAKARNHDEQHAHGVICRTRVAPQDSASV